METMVVRSVGLKRSSSRLSGIRTLFFSFLLVIIGIFIFSGFVILALRFGLGLGISKGSCASVFV